MTYEQAGTIIRLLRFIKGCAVAFLVSKSLKQLIDTQLVIQKEEE